MSRSQYDKFMNNLALPWIHEFHNFGIALIAYYKRANSFKTASCPAVKTILKDIMHNLQYMTNLAPFQDRAFHISGRDLYVTVQMKENSNFLQKSKLDLFLYLLYSHNHSEIRLKLQNSGDSNSLKDMSHHNRCITLTSDRLYNLEGVMKKTEQQIKDLQKYLSVVMINIDRIVGRSHNENGFS